MAPATMGPQYQTAAGAWQGEALLPDLNTFARDWMQNYNPLDSGYGKTALDASNANLRKMEQDQTRGIEEWAASRGLVGSSYEGDQMVGMNESLRRTALDEQARIMELVGNMELMGRQAAGNFGLGVGDFGRALGNDRRAEGQYGYEADRTRSRDFEDDGRYRTDTALDAAGMQGDADLNRYLADLEAKRIAETGIIDRAQLGLDRDDLSQRSWRDNASVTRDYDLMDQDDEQYAGDEAYRRDEFAENKRQYDGDSAFRDRELDAKTKAEEDKLIADILSGDIEITPEMAAWIKEKYGFEMPASTTTTAGAGATAGEGGADAGTQYAEKPKSPPAGKTDGDGFWRRSATGLWEWQDDHQDWWNPGDWFD
jgi:hypothetical protein